MGGEGLTSVLLYSGLAGLSALAGSYLLLTHEDWARRTSLQLIGFAAGTLLGAAFGAILPEAQQFVPEALLFLLLGFLAFFTMEHAITIHVHHDPSSPHHSLGMLGVVGLSFHSLIDGIIIGAGYELEAFLGLIAAVAVVSHRFMDGISVTAFVLHAGYSRRLALARSWAVALAPPLGAMGSFFLLSGVDRYFLGAFLAMAAGTYVYVAASDIIPETRLNSRWSNVPLVLGGAALILLLRSLIGAQ